MSVTEVPGEPRLRARVPGPRDAVWFEFRAMCFRARRWLRDRLDHSHRRHPARIATEAWPVVAETRSPLWPTADAPERSLVLGKIENLRVARRAFDGIRLGRGDVLSFWAQLGRPSRWRGFVVGRELREGCLIPSIGGGLCQLSNALYDVALKAGLEVIERHAHSQVVPGSAAARDRDATVFWNYVDLRIRASYDLWLEVDLDAEALTVRIRSAAPQAAHVLHAPALPSRRDARSHAPGDCATCGQTECFRNAPATPDAAHENGPVLLCDRPMPEHAAFLDEMPGLRREAIPMTPLWRLQRALLALRHRLAQATPARRGVEQAEQDAAAVARRLRPDDIDVYVDQAWLPYLWRRGALAGRRVHVLMRALPMDAIQAALDDAVLRHPDEPTLRDFRADPALLAAERAALAAARRWIGPHATAVPASEAKSVVLPWRMPVAATREATRAPGPLRVLFPASSLVRKGVLTVAEALRGMPVEVLLPARDGGEPTRWADLPLTRIEDPGAALARCDVVVLPAWVEHQPRALLAAMAQGVPVIATAACGLGALPGWIEVPPGDTEALRAMLQRIADALPRP